MVTEQDAKKYIIGTKALVEAAVHIGHKKSLKNPKMDKYIYLKKGFLNIIDTEKTLKCLTEAYNFLKSISETPEGEEVDSIKRKPIIFVGTKQKASKTIIENAIRCEELFVGKRWLGGTLTNKMTITRNINNWARLELDKKQGKLNSFTKKEQTIKLKDIKRYTELYRGIKTFKNNLPKAMIIVDINKEKVALSEAKKFNIPVIALVNTNCNPEGIQYPIPCNDDNEKSINLIITLLADAIIEGKKLKDEEGKPVELRMAYDEESYKPIPKKEKSPDGKYAPRKPFKKDFTEHKSSKKFDSDNSSNNNKQK